MNIIEKFEKHLNTSALTPKERQYLKDNGITLTNLNDKYNYARRRSTLRGTYILPKNAFYREWISKANMLKYHKKIENISEALSFDVHSKFNDGAYLTFELLPKAEHIEHHKKLRREEAHRIIKAGELECKHCHSIKPLDNFPKSTQSLLGRIRTCKACSAAQRKLLKAFKDGEVA